MKRIFIIISLLLTYRAVWSEPLLILQGNPLQGSLLVGIASTQIDHVFLNAQPIQLHNQKFIIGFDRDAKLEHQLTLFQKNGDYHQIKFNIENRSYPIEVITGIPQQYTSSPQNDELNNRIKSEREIMTRAREQIRQSILAPYAERFCNPLPGGRITSLFGQERIMNDIPQGYHRGVDLARPAGTPIRVMAPGQVVLTGDFYYNGRFVLLDHGGGLSSIYMHLDSIGVETGQYLDLNDEIGTVGATGRVTGAHLHWGVNWYDWHLDPLEVIAEKEDFIIIR